jgi:hypothetical protein
MQNQMTEELHLPEECIRLFELENKLYPNGLGCNAYYDSLICWEASLANTTLVKNCPSFQGIFDTNSTISHLNYYYFFLLICCFKNLYQKFV